ncbi:hypothetical protein ABG79_02131 [Caloramator mitchellensis]|uniref:ABC-2 family transporter protein n=1 Tax=Caloramator mitchellensis TaxID=908809 RepID=A0A0R3JRK0_CALMK|nr:ABC-2 family transporter protein [Caloramator mitchellensis]KRQ86097.1 hypothetical protein ABG79_02131 [Caloramator mitchellensis]
MLMAVRRHLKLILVYMKYNLKSSMEYKASFLIQIFGMILNNGSFLIFWWVIYKNVNKIGGYGFSDVIILWGLASSSFGLTYILFGNLRELSEFIISGRLDSYLIQPVDVVLNAAASKMEVSAWGDLAYGYILLFLSGRYSLIDFILFTLFTITGAIIYFSMLLILNSLAFYFGNVDSTKRAVDSFFISFSTYPEGILNKYFKFIFYSVVPVGFSIYLPVSIFKSFSLKDTIIVIISAIVFLALSYKTFYAGLKRYESANLLEAKI